MIYIPGTETSPCKIKVNQYLYFHCMSKRDMVIIINIVDHNDNDRDNYDGGYQVSKCCHWSVPKWRIKSKTVFISDVKYVASMLLKVKLFSF